MTTSPRPDRARRVRSLEEPTATEPDVLAANRGGLAVEPSRQVDPQARTRRRQRIVRRVFMSLLALVGIAVVVVSFTGLPEQAAEPVRLLTAKATTGTARTEVSGSGTVAPATEIDLTFGDTSASTSTAGGAGGQATTSASSTVSTVSVKAGQKVKRGAVLAVLDDTQAKLDLQAAQDSYDAAVAERDDPATTTSDGTTEQVQTDEALDLAVAEAAVALKQAETALDGTTITAPGTGVIDAVNITRGSTPPSDLAAIVLRSASMAVTIDVAEDDISDLAVGQKATVHIVALDEDVTGTVTSVDASDEAADTTAAAGGGATTSSVVSFPVRVQLARIPAGLRPGMSAEVVVTTAQHTDAVLVPLTAVVGSGDNARVRVPGADGAIEMTQVTLGLLTSKNAEVTEGIAAGDTVVTGIVQKKSTAEESSTSALGGVSGGNTQGGFGGPGGGMGGAPPGGTFGGQRSAGAAGGTRG